VNQNYKLEAPMAGCDWLQKPFLLDFPHRNQQNMVSTQDCSYPCLIKIDFYYLSIKKAQTSPAISY